MDIEHYKAEISALRRKLESKTEALLILNQELNKCRIERNQFRSMFEKFQTQNVPIKELKSFEDYGLYSGCYSCNHQLQEIKEKTKSLQFEIESLKQKLNDAQGDIKVLRKENQNLRSKENNNVEDYHQKEVLIKQVEELVVRVKQLECDLQAVLDEKEELVTERDVYRSKVHRLTHQLQIALKAEASVDVDALVMENRYLQQRLDQALADKEMTLQSLTKYKAMLDKRRTKGTVRLGTNTSKLGLVISHKQVQELLDEGNSWQLPNTEATLADLRSLSGALLEALQDKALALQHQKKANKILAGRITELEERFAKDSHLPAFPSRVLLEGYSSANVDKDIGNETLEDVIEYFTEDQKVCDKVDDTLPIESRSNHFSDNSSGESPKESEDCLPPDLQELVLKAMQEMKEVSHSIN